LLLFTEEHVLRDELGVVVAAEDVRDELEATTEDVVEGDSVDT
jgi:hypothetical protein